MTFVPSAKLLLDLFAPIEPYSSGFIKVDDIHEIYWEQSGNPEGQPIVIFHGGPGGGSSPVMRQFFDPNFYRIIIFDQRGCGKSNPLGELKNNSTAHILSDIESLREHLEIDKWHLYGGSWGSTLALTYASKHTDKCLSMVLRGIFLMTAEEIDWFLNGMKTIYPEAWDQFVEPLNDEERADILGAYHKKLTSDNEIDRMEAATSWALYESACASLIPNYQIITTPEQKHKAYSISKIEAHFFKNENFERDYDLINQVDTFRDIPTIIVQGRYDVVCPILTAHRLHQKWPEADFVVVPDGGHSSMDRSMRAALVGATQEIKKMNLS